MKISSLVPKSGSSAVLAAAGFFFSTFEMSSRFEYYFKIEFAITRVNIWKNHTFHLMGITGMLLPFDEIDRKSI